MIIVIQSQPKQCSLTTATRLMHYFVQHHNRREFFIGLEQIHLLFRFYFKSENLTFDVPLFVKTQWLNKKIKGKNNMNFKCKIQVKMFVMLLLLLQLLLLLMPVLLLLLFMPVLLFIVECRLVVVDILLFVIVEYSLLLVGSKVLVSCWLLFSVWT